MLETEKNLHSENKKLTKGGTQASDAKERVMVKKKKTKKIVFARGLMGLMVITKCLLYQEQEKDISVNENAKLD